MTETEALEAVRAAQSPEARSAAINACVDLFHRATLAALARGDVVEASAVADRARPQCVAYAYCRDAIRSFRADCST